MKIICENITRTTHHHFQVNLESHEELLVVVSVDNESGLIEGATVAPIEYTENACGGNGPSFDQDIGDQVEIDIEEFMMMQPNQAVEPIINQYNARVSGEIS